MVIGLKSSGEQLGFTYQPARDQYYRSDDGRLVIRIVHSDTYAESYDIDASDISFVHQQIRELRLEPEPQFQAVAIN